MDDPNYASASEGEIIETRHRACAMFLVRLLPTAIDETAHALRIAIAAFPLAVKSATKDTMIHTIVGMADPISVAVTTTKTATATSPVLSHMPT